MTSEGEKREEILRNSVDLFLAPPVETMGHWNTKSGEIVEAGYQHAKRPLLHGEDTLKSVATRALC